MRLLSGRREARTPSMVKSAPALLVPLRGDAAQRPNESLYKDAFRGWLVIVLFFGVMGTWAVTAPLHGAVVANSVIKVLGNRKSVQHLDGGIVKQLNVKEADHVNTGDVLIVLDDTQARAELEVFSQEYLVARATEMRLLAELDRNSRPVPSADIQARLSEPEAQSIWNGQLQQFESRRAALEGQRNVIREKINQLEAQIAGSEKQIVAYKQQIDSVNSELDSITPLVVRGLVAQPRKMQLERTAYGLQGQIEEATANIAKSRQAIAEQIQQMAQLDNDRMAEVTKDLRDTQAKVLDVIPRLANAKAVLARMNIRSPYTGIVVGLNVFAMGAVIQRGDKILDIVPDSDALTIEAQVAVEDISEVHPGMTAEIHLTAYKQRITPMVHGEVLQVSADRLTDNRTGAPYYTALVRINEQELAELPNVHLYPGMPAVVMIPTVKRTAFDYIVGPLVQSFNRAFRQR